LSGFLIIKLFKIYHFIFTCYNNKKELNMIIYKGMSKVDDNGQEIKNV